LVLKTCPSCFIQIDVPALVHCGFVVRF
jgi:hypothetical protein